MGSKRAGRTRQLLEKQQEILREKERLSLDQKTGLYGVTAYGNRLEQFMRADPVAQNLAMCMLDLDNFKQVNDTYGHAHGDEVILSLARLIKQFCGSRFFPVRFGGEEFIILFYGGERAEYQSIVECLLEKFAALRYEFTNQTITCSAGLAFLEKGVDAKMLFDQADQALYQSKAEGKNRLTVFLYQNEEEKAKCLTKS